MNLPKNVDLTNGSQKAFALVLLGAVLFLLYYLLPPLNFIFKHAWLAILLGVPLLFLIYNYQVIWHEFKRLSWALTKWSINKDKPSYLYKFHEWVVGKVEDLKGRVQKIKGLKATTFEKIKNVKGEIHEENRRAEAAIKQNQDLVAKTSIKKIKIKERLLEKLLPRYDYLTQTDIKLSSVLEIRQQEVEDLKYFIDSKIEEYETFKEIDDAIKDAGLEEDTSSDYKNYLESLKQMEQEMGLYAANIEMFDAQIKPLIAKAAVDKEVADEEALKFIEDYKTNRYVPAFKELANVKTETNTNS